MRSSIHAKEEKKEIEERAKRLREKSRRGFINISEMKGFHAEKQINLVVDVLSKESEKALDYFARSLEKSN